MDRARNTIGVFILETHNPSGTNLGSFFLRLCYSSGKKTGTRHPMRLDEQPRLVRLQRRTKVDSSSRRIMRPYNLPVFILDELNRRRKNVYPSSSQMNYASLI